VSLAVWLEATRPRTLPAAAAPVAIGVALAWSVGGLHVGAALAALAGALLIQVGTNYANDYFDFVKGADTDARVGPRRATQAGLVSPAAMRAAFILTFALAVALGGYLVSRAGWSIVVVGALSVLFGVLYTGGPRPLGYLGLGDVLVLVFFGPVAVGGTVYVQTLTLPPAAIIAGLAPGLLSTAILAVNNLRDVDTDILAGKRTLAVRFGKTFARLEYAACVVIALALPVGLAAWLSRPWLALPLLASPLAARLIRDVATSDGPALNPLLGRTGKLLVLFSALFCVGWAL
jgi:1,4-dihydroxy-2-naphthoate octaprenyltransferase